MEILKAIYRKIRFFYWSWVASKKGSFNYSEKEKAILFFLPEAGISTYIKNLLIIASQLRLKGHKIYFIRCFNLFERCVFMDSESLSIEATAAQKKLLCTYCIRSFHKHVVENNFEYIDLRNFSLESDAFEIKKVIENTPGVTFDYSLDDIKLTDSLKYNFFLFLKKSDLTNLTPLEISLWQQQLISLYVGYKAIARLIEQLHPHRIIMSEEYSLNLIVKAMSKKSNFTLTNIGNPFHRDIDRTYARIFQKDWVTECWEAIDRWSDFKQLCLTSTQIKESTDDLIIKMINKGVYSYSPLKSLNASLFDKMRLQKNRKTIVAYTSSPDEAEALINSYRSLGLPLRSIEDAFTNQFEWLDELIEYVEHSQNFQLIIRLHPRMAPNHREAHGCPAASEFKIKYSHVYKHVNVIWPEESISSFDIAELADVVTVAWSSMGLFMAKMGVPVISGLKLSLALPNDTFHWFSKDKTDYFHKIELLSNNNPDSQVLKEAFRFYNMITLGNCIELGDVVSSKADNLKELSKNAHMLEKAIINSENVLEMNLSELRKAQSEQMHLEEGNELQKQLYRIIHVLMTNMDEFGEEKIDINWEGVTQIQNATSSLNIMDKEVEYFYQGNKYTKYSPMVVRMANLVKKISSENL
jgi:hypothetical protein